MKIITTSKLLLLAIALITQNVFSAPNVTTNLGVISGPNFKVKRGLVVAIGGFRDAERQRIDFVESLGLDMVTLAQNLCDFTNEFEKPLHQFYENNEGTVSVRVDPDVIKVRQYAAAKNLRVVHQISGVPYRCIFINKEWDSPILPILEERQWTGNANWYPVADHNYRGTIGGIIGRWAQAVEAADGSFSSIWAGTQEPSHTVGFPAGPDGSLIRTPEQVSNNVNLYFHSWKRTAKLLNEVGIETGGLQLNEADTAYFDQTLKNFRDTDTPLDYFTAQNYAADRGVGDYLKAAKTALQNNGYPWEKKVLFNRYSLKKPDNWEVNSAGIIHWLKAEKQIINNADILYGYSLEYSKAANSILLSETLRFVHDMIGVRRPLNSTIDGLDGFIGANKQRFTAVIWNSSGTNQNLELKIQNMPEDYSNMQLKTTLVKAQSQSEIEGTFNKANGIVQIDGIPDKGYLLIEISHAPAGPSLAAGRPVQVFRR